MDSEKFDKIVLDLLYDELDELTRASAIRYTEQSARAKALYSELRATREVGALPLVDPPADLESKILAAEARARAERPLTQRLGTLVSIVAGYAMKPQLAMAALLMLMLGSSLLFLRVKPGEPSSVQVTERGVPESDREQVAVVSQGAASAAPDLGLARAAPAAPRGRGEAHAAGDEKARSAPLAEEPAAAPAGAADQASGNRASGDVVARDDAYGSETKKTGEDLDNEDLAREDQRPARHSSSCETERARYDDVAAHDPASANDAKWALARCYDASGRIEQARTAYTALLTVPSYADRARKALDLLQSPLPQYRAAGKAAAAAGAPAAAKAAPAKPAAPPPAATQSP